MCACAFYWSDPHWRFGIFGGGVLAGSPFPCVGVCVFFSYIFIFAMACLELVTRACVLLVCVLMCLCASSFCAPSSSPSNAAPHHIDLHERTSVCVCVLFFYLKFEEKNSIFWSEWFIVECWLCFLFSFDFLTEDIWKDSRFFNFMQPIYIYL